MTIHHIVFDRTSAVILLSTLLNFYRQLCVGRPIQIPDAPCGYERFVALEDELPFSKLGRSHAEYWRRQLSAAIRTCELPPDLPRAATPSFRGATVSMELPDGPARAVNALSLTHHVNRSVIFLGVFQLLLHRCTGQDEIIVGMPVTRRTAGEFADQVGYFINMVPIRIRCDGGLRFSEFLRTVQGTMLDALYHSSYPFSWMVAGLRQEATGKNSIFNIDFLYQDFLKKAVHVSGPHQEDLRIEAVGSLTQEGDSDFTLEILEKPTAFSFNVKYNPDMYTRNRVGGFLERYHGLLAAACERPDTFTPDLRIEAPARP